MIHAHQHATKRAQERLGFEPTPEQWRQVVLDITNAKLDIAPRHDRMINRPPTIPPDNPVRRVAPGSYPANRFTMIGRRA